MSRIIPCNFTGPLAKKTLLAPLWNASLADNSVFKAVNLAGIRALGLDPVFMSHSISIR
jgi:hypothetical protein